MKNFLAVTILACSLTSGCGNDTESFNTARLLASAVTDRPSAKERPAEASISRSLLNTIITPVQLITNESSGQQAVVAKIEENNGVETWSTVDKVTVSFRNDVVVATRGLGADLMAADVPPLSLLSAAGSEYSRSYVWLSGTDQPIKTVFTCKIRDRQRQTIVIVEISHETSHIVEACRSDKTLIENEFWFDNAQQLRRSRQWIGKDVGYLLIEDVRR